MKSDPLKICILEGDACTTSWNGYSGLQYQIPEIRTRIAQLLQELENNVDNPAVRFLKYRELYKYIEEAGMHRQQASQVIVGVDVTFDQEKFTGPEVTVPSATFFNKCLGGSNSSAGDPDMGFKAYSLAVHEAGHALGLSRLDFSAYPNPLVAGAIEAINLIPGISKTIKHPYHAAHPTIPDSVMNYDDEDPPVIRHPSVKTTFAEPDCSPHPFDIMAIMALYQNVPK